MSDQTASIPSALRAHRVNSFQPGPKLIVLGAVHGNEVCGSRAIERVLAEIDAGQLPITRGSVTFVPITNPLAYAKVQRQGERNLNRNLFPTDNPKAFEDYIASVLCPWLAEHDVLLDLHSFQASGQPFALCGPENNNGELEPFAQAAEENRLLAHLGVTRIVEGWMSAYQKGVTRRQQNQDQQSYDDPGLTDARYGVGTTEYMRANGGYAVTLECGQHDDPRAPEVAYRAIRQTLALLRLVELPLAPPQGPFQILKLEDVTDREHSDDSFTRAWSSFDAVKKGEAIGRRHNGRELTAPSDGYIVFPNAKAAPGREWYYFARDSERRILTEA